jgi:putative chitinase|tara:strand:+ start:228 stop:851 length:624 start_codon:yes stop_codon:yes gene_type:complete
MNFEFTLEQLKQMVPSCKHTEELYDALLEVCPRYEIDTEDRVAAFVAQCGHESMDFNTLKENLNYSAKALDAVFGKYFKRAGVDATEYARQPEKIANRVYASRMSNGDEESGDGWKFRGRGAIQLTGCANYTKFAEDTDQSIEDAVVYLETLQGAVESAAWFWKTNGLNPMADERDNTKMTKRINGGTHGIEDRKERYVRNLGVLLG